MSEQSHIPQLNLDSYDFSPRVIEIIYRKIKDRHMTQEEIQDLLEKMQHTCEEDRIISTEKKLYLMIRAHVLGLHIERRQVHHEDRDLYFWIISDSEEDQNLSEDLLTTLGQIHRRKLHHTDIGCGYISETVCEEIPGFNEEMLIETPKIIGSRHIIPLGSPSGISMAVDLTANHNISKYPWNNWVTDPHPMDCIVFKSQSELHHLYEMISQLYDSPTFKFLPRR